LWHPHSMSRQTVKTMTLLHRELFFMTYSSVTVKVLMPF